MLLPFKTEPKSAELVLVGAEECGTLEIKKLNGLTPAEHGFIQRQGLPDTQKRMVQSARNIAERTGASFVEVYDEFVARIGGRFNLLSVGDRVTIKNIKKLDGKVGTISEFVDEDKFAMIQVDDSVKVEKVSLQDLDRVSVLNMAECLDEILECQSMLQESADRRKLVYATAIARYRLSPQESLGPLEAFAKVAEKVLVKRLDQRAGSEVVRLIRQELEDECEIFSIEAMALQHPALVQALAEFASKEETGWPKPEAEEGEKPEAVTEEALGKS
jgi:hypothetical protein